MRKSKNYYKFMEYMAFGISGWHEDAVMVDNGVIECVAYPKVAHIEDYSKLYKCNYDKMTMDSDNTWLTIKCVLVNEEVINVYYVTNECNLYIGQLILDDYRTQKQALDAIHKKVVCFFLNSREFCELHPTEEEINEYEEILETGEESTEDCNEYEEILDSTESTERDRINYLMETHSISALDFEYRNLMYTDEYKNKMNPTKEIKGHIYIDTDSVKIAPLPEKNVSESYRKHLHAIMNPEWHHVSLATLANIDFDMLDKKRQVYLKAHRELKRTLLDLSKCKTGHTYEARARKFMRDMISKYYDNEISYAMRKYLDLQLSMSNVVNGVWSSYVEPAMGLHESRRYSRPTLTY